LRALCVTVELLQGVEHFVALEGRDGIRRIEASELPCVPVHATDVESRKLPSVPAHAWQMRVYEWGIRNLRMTLVKWSVSDVGTGKTSAAPANCSSLAVAYSVHLHVWKLRV
jgi:hypothetical protein